MSEVIGHYSVLDRLGTGTLGALYRARDTRLGRTVALRVVDEAIAADPARLEPLLSATRAALALSHPNVAARYEVGEDAGRPFLAMEFVQGEDLGRLMDGRPMSPRRAVGYAIQIADALAEAHAMGFTHEHLTPASVTVTPKGNAKIVDFGLGRWTRLGRSADPVPDLSALGAILTALLAG